MMATTYRPASGRGVAWPAGIRRVPPAVAHAAGCALAFAVVLAGGIHLADAADWSGRARSHALLEAARAHATDAERVLAAAAQRGDARIASGSGDRSPPEPEWAAVMLALADLVASNGLRIASIEPQGADAAGPDGRRAVRIVADGGFPALRRVIDGLARFPVLVVPAALHVERGPLAARVEMSLDVFPALPGVTAGAGAKSAAAAAVAPDDDPFSGAGSSEAAAGLALRLAGVIRGVSAGLAVFDDGDGAFLAVAPGEALGMSRVVRVDAGAVTLATADGPHRLVLNDGARP
ncbi:GspMb/PilO family protein [Burkholderia stagnalis]